MSIDSKEEAARSGTGADYIAAILPRRHFFNDMPDKGLFAGVAAFGFGVIIGFKILEVPAEVVATIAVTIMLIYGMIAYRIPAVRLRLDRLGDNFYYLGFIFTLASLSAALVQIRRGIDVDAVIGSFGIALVSTIVGIAGRVVFVQMRSEIDDVEEIIRRDLLEASASLKAQLSAALHDLDTFRMGVRQATSESLQETTDYAKAHVHQIASVAQEAATRIEAAFDGNRVQAERLSEIVARASAAIEQIFERTAQAELPTDRIAAFANALEGFVVHLGRTVASVTEVKRKRRWWHRALRSSSNDFSSRGGWDDNARR